MGQRNPVGLSPSQEEIRRYIGEMASGLAVLADDADLGELSAVLRLVGLHAGGPQGAVQTPKSTQSAERAG